MVNVPPGKMYENADIIKDIISQVSVVLYWITLHEIWLNDIITARDRISDLSKAVDGCKIMLQYEEASLIADI